MILYLAIFVIISVPCLALLKIAFNILNLYGLSKVEYTIFELTPPLNNSIPVEKVVHYFDLVHRIYILHADKNNILKRSDTLSLEITSSRSSGIRFYTRVPTHICPNFRQSLVSYIPGIKIRVVKDNLTNFKMSSKWSRILEYKLSGKPINKIKTIEESEHSDPLTYLLGALGLPEKEEFYNFQMVLSPVLRSNSFRQLTKDRYKFRHLIDMCIWFVFKALRLTMYFGFGIIKVILGAENLGKTPIHDERADVPAQNSIMQKLSQPLFDVDLRLLVCANSQSNLNSRVTGFSSSLSVFDNLDSQGILAKRLPIISNLQKYRAFTYFKFKNRLPSILSSNSCLLSSDEIGTLFHFPYTESDEKVLPELGRNLPASARNKKITDENRLDVVLGKNVYHGIETPLGLTETERQRHGYIIGGTGNGKTTMMQYAIIQDIKNGKGVAVIDPHGDMAEFLIDHIPKDRVDDVIYFNPYDISYPIGMNLLELQKTKSEDDLLREKDLITESVVSIFRKLFSESDSGGHRIEYVLRNTVQTALTIKGATLFTVYDLLNDPVFRKSVVKDLEDKNLKNFWWHELGRAGDMQKVKLSIGITSKVGRFLFSASARRSLEQTKSTIDFDGLLNTKKILICNFSKGLIGEDTSQLFGAMLLAKLQIASLHRAKVPQEERLPFYLYVDEFQNFATPSFIQMLSESRKYKLFMMLAEQSTSQQANRKMVNTMLANIGTLICFRTANPEDESLLLPLFNSRLRSGDIANLPAFNFYMRQAAIKVHEPVSGVTLLADVDGDYAPSSLVVNSSRRNNAKKFVKKRKNNVRQQNITQIKKRVIQVPQVL